MSEYTFSELWKLTKGLQQPKKYLFKRKSYILVRAVSFVEF